ncbi:MAG: hypothetical protein IPJ48_14830 [Propionivibrio sp.]|uniref:Uncharacterized protein n=1 Tax=Candidatus Propionivibrio dominans TaxID=2954373 RepID=A0A9D7FE44_9RHOO|nr:hypothetical protein [Candidatus Propionivibrio dominans]
MDRLHRQADAQVAAVALEHADVAAHHVVQYLVAASIELVVHRGGVVLHVDPVGHHHRRGHDQLQHLEAGVAFPPVVVQEAAAGEIHVLAAAARCDDKGGTAGETPFGPHLRPVAGARLDGLMERGG